MSWTLTILNTSTDIKRINELTEHSIIPLGSKDEVIKMICSAFPTIAISNRDWLTLRTDHYSLAFGLGTEEQVDTIGIHVQGDVKAVDAIAHLCRLTGWKALDAAIGDFIDFNSDERSKGFIRSQEYRHYIEEKHH